MIAGPSPFGGGREGAVVAAKDLGLRLEVIDVRVAEDYEAAFRRTSTEIILNLATARTLGIVVPPSVLSRATEVLR